MSEREDVLIICSNNPHKKNKEIFEEIIRWEIPNKSFQLISQNSKDFQDIYFDFHDKSFQKMKLAMRIRKTYNENFVTIKIPSGEKIKTGRDDIEIEKSYSKEGLIEIFTYLRNISIEKELNELKQFKNKVDKILLRLSDDNFRITNDTIESIQSLGLQVVQDRYTHREIRNAIRNDGKFTKVLAQLAIDSVIYAIDGKDIHHYDIEVEEVNSLGALARKAIMESFASSIYNPSLIKWPYGKLVLGKGLEELFKDGDLPKDEFDNLSIITYRKVEGMINNGLI